MEGSRHMSAPQSLDDLCDAMRSAEFVRICGTRTKLGYLPETDAADLPVSGLAGIIQHDVADQVVEVWAGTKVCDLQAELARHGQCLPLPPDEALPTELSCADGTVGGLLAMNMPHALSAQSGGPREWTLGMTVVRPDGSVAKCGSKVVKSVAGYDIHKLFVGSRGELGVIAKAALRTFPIRAMPEHEARVHSQAPGPLFVARSLRTGFEEAVRSAVGLVADDPPSCTVWQRLEPRRPPDGWCVGPGGFRRRTRQSAELEAKAKAVFDPDGKFAPGWTL
ncbi:MAG: FAD-binding oxidoreductase [Armatimonadetes bacterium]|nr:FAD-binding oxidoreductase [Armatimonadota bacterium]